MPRFDPRPGTKLQIGSRTYEVMPHPSAPAMPFGQEGRKATVYQVMSDRQFFALKIFKKPYRLSKLVETYKVLAQFKQMAGLEVCNRLCLTHAMEPKLLRQYDDLEFAVLMPWIEGRTWFDIVFAKQAIDSDTSMQLAKRTAEVLAGWEAQDVAHCDVAGANIIVNTDTGAVSLIDVEDMYGTGLRLTDNFPAGTAGYQHLSLHQAEHGQWCAEGDRFSGAILLAEILTWRHPEIRALSNQEHYFSLEELQNAKSLKYRLMNRALSYISEDLSDLFMQVWTSEDLSECPSLVEWARRLKVGPRPPRVVVTNHEKVAKKRFVDVLTAIAAKPDSPEMPRSTGADDVDKDGTIPLEVAVPQPSAQVPVQAPTIEMPEPKVPEFRVGSSGVKQVQTSEKFTIEWTRIPGTEWYELQRTGYMAVPPKEHDYNLYVNPCVNNQYSTYYVTVGKRYYRVRAIDKQGDKSNWSSPLVIDVVTPPQFK